MFVSHRDGNTTSTIKVNVASDLFWAGAFFAVGFWLTVNAIWHPIEYCGALVIGLVLLLIGYSLGEATLRLVARAARVYFSATEPRQ